MLRPHAHSVKAHVTLFQNATSTCAHRKSTRHTMMQCYEAAQCGVPNVHAQAQAQAQRTCSRSESTGADHKGKSKMVMRLNVMRCDYLRRHKLKPGARAPSQRALGLFIREKARW
jgi:hypothetical protein